jgi:hypothetical protein
VVVGDVVGLAVEGEMGEVVGDVRETLPREQTTGPVRAS